jgi:anti-anti-sigma factor
MFLGMMVARLTGLRLLPAGRPAGAPPADLPARGLAPVALPPMSGPEAAAEFCSRHEPAARERGIVLDLSGFAWLNSVELGVVAVLARAARRGGCAVILSGVRSRVRRLLRLFRMDRVVDLPASSEEWAAVLGEPAAVRGTEWLEEGEQCRVVLPVQFECGEAWRAQEEAERRAADGRLRRVVVDGRRLRYIDSSGLQFLKTVRRCLDAIPGGAMSVRSFPEPALDLLRREGLGSIPADASGPG